MSRMLDEIRQQPEALEHTLLGAARRGKSQTAPGKPPEERGVVRGVALLEITTGIPVSLAAPSISTLYGAIVDYRETLLVAISQSGESTDTNMVLERARGQGALTLGITNERGSTLARLAEDVFLVRAGKEKSVAATKTYTGQMLVLYLLASALGGAIKVRELRPESSNRGLSCVPGRAAYLDTAPWRSALRLAASRLSARPKADGSVCTKCSVQPRHCF